MAGRANQFLVSFGPRQSGGVITLRFKTRAAAQKCVADWNDVLHEAWWAYQDDFGGEYFLRVEDYIAVVINDARKGAEGVRDHAVASNVP